MLISFTIDLVYFGEYNFLDRLISFKELVEHKKNKEDDYHG